jgi:hypothetical protein
MIEGNASRQRHPPRRVAFVPIAILVSLLLSFCSTRGAHDVSDGYVVVNGVRFHYVDWAATASGCSS